MRKPHVGAPEERESRSRRTTREEATMARPIHVTDRAFDAEVLTSDIPVLADFWAEWCGPCKMVAPVLEEIAEEYNGELKIAKLDVDENGQTARRYGVKSIPTLILFTHGQSVERLMGAMPKEQLLSRIRPHLAKTCGKA
jgi:thioredoxin 1